MSNEIIFGLIGANLEAAKANKKKKSEREQTIDTVIELIEGEKVDEMSASEGNRTVEISDNLWSRLRGSHKPEWIAAEIYNKSLDNIISKLKSKGVR